MIVERIIFYTLAFALFVVMFLKMLHKNDTNYIYVLGAQAVGITISFIGLVFRINLPIVLIIITYIISIILPVTIIIFESKGLYLSEIISVKRAKHYSKNKDVEKAKQILMLALEKFPNSYYIHRELASVNEKSKNKEIAIDEYIKASDLNPMDYDLKIKTAELLKNTQRGEEAIRILDEILKEKPDCYEASNLLGNILYEEEKYKEAVNVYMQALTYNPEEYDIYYNLGMLFTALNDFQSAKEYYEQAASLNSLLYHAKYNLAQIALLYNEIEEAENYLTECINDESILDEVYYYLAYIAMLKGNKDDAIQYLNTAVEENVELYEKACKETVFSMIIKDIKKPTNTSKQRKKLTTKEKQIMRHLEETCAVVGNLNHNDIKVIRQIREKEKMQGIGRQETGKQLEIKDILGKE